jgi:hypothetical protein
MGKDNCFKKKLFDNLHKHYIAQSLLGSCKNQPLCILTRFYI